jgi:acyl-CoA synthetase (AMP-forming)/AMP-acid ligase II
VVQDGLQGFSATLLAPTTGNARLKVAHGRLFVRSTRRALNVQADSSGWIDTGDLVEVVGERVLFKGRAGRQLINVGGQKAYPADVESVLLAHPDVRWCQVEARRAPLVGSLVTAKVVAVTGGQDADLERRLTAHCQARLPEYAVPRIYEFLGEIPVAGNLKSAL